MEDNISHLNHMEYVLEHLGLNAIPCESGEKVMELSKAKSVDGMLSISA